MHTLDPYLYGECEKTRRARFDSTVWVVEASDLSSIEGDRSNRSQDCTCKTFSFVNPQVMRDMHEQQERAFALPSHYVMGICLPPDHDK